MVRNSKITLHNTSENFNINIVHLSRDTEKLGYYILQVFVRPKFC